MKTTNEILDRVRDLCGLKRLEFGCYIKHKAHTGLITVINGAPDCGMITTCFGEVWSVEDIEIIGLEVQLNHLLMVLPRTSECLLGIDSGIAVLRVNDYASEYNLSLSVSENLSSNDQLRQLISELIF